jgi:hypothetical protein
VLLALLLLLLPALLLLAVLLLQYCRLLTSLNFSFAASVATSTT